MYITSWNYRPEAIYYTLSLQPTFITNHMIFDTSSTLKSKASEFEEVNKGFEIKMHVD